MEGVGGRKGEREEDMMEWSGARVEDGVERGRNIGRMEAGYI